MFRYFIVLVVVLSHFFSLSKVSAVEVKNLYNAKVIVNSQTDSERQRALQQAMRAVVLKVGGQQALLSNSTIKKGLKNYSRYVANYRYQRKSDKTELLVSFDEGKINQLFEQASAPIWGSLRPQILLWLVEENGLQRTTISNATYSSFSDNNTSQVSYNFPVSVENFSTLRGLPIVMPLMDLTDMNTISTFDVWGRFAEQVQAASQRYNPESIIIIRLSNSSLVPEQAYYEEIEACLLCQEKPQSYALDWSFIADAQSYNSDKIGAQIFGEISYGTAPDKLLEQALSIISDKIYQKYALNSGVDKDYVIDVANISSLRNFIEVERFLQQLSSVKSVKLLKASGNNRRFELALKSSGQAFLALLKLNQQLDHFVDPLAEKVVDAVPVFYWKP
ncbi:MAG: DUF2066 domain-containing protein [Colwellia sp.]|nr:DUF2066 domain-containing protein [Colwellia sp.]